MASQCSNVVTCSSKAPHCSLYARKCASSREYLATQTHPCTEECVWQSIRCLAGVTANIEHICRTYVHRHLCIMSSICKTTHVSMCCNEAYTLAQPDIHLVDCRWSHSRDWPQSWLCDRDGLNCTCKACVMAFASWVAAVRSCLLLGGYLCADHNIKVP